MYHLASAALFYNVPGDFCELGCHEGKSAVVFQRILQHYDPSRNLHLYDSFEGLPNASAENGHANAHKGDMATTKDALIANFKRLNLRQPILHQGWFEDTLPTQLPDKIAFAHLDGDPKRSRFCTVDSIRFRRGREQCRSAIESRARWNRANAERPHRCLSNTVVFNRQDPADKNDSERDQEHDTGVGAATCQGCGHEPR